jgi:hypothetical protein
MGAAVNTGGCNPWLRRAGTRSGETEHRALLRIFVEHTNPKTAPGRSPRLADNPAATAAAIGGRCSRQRLTRPPADLVVEMAGFAACTWTAIVSRLVCSSRAILHWNQPRPWKAIIACWRLTRVGSSRPAQPEGARGVTHPLNVAGFDRPLTRQGERRFWTKGRRRPKWAVA